MASRYQVNRMDAHNRPFKKPSKKHQPKGMEILFEDAHIIVIDKSSGLLTVGTANERSQTAFFLLTDYVRKGNPKSHKRVFIVHRLDRETSGILVFAKTEAAKRYLQDHWQEFSKTYTAVVQGILAEKTGLFKSFLLENKSYRVHSVAAGGQGKWSETGYKVVRESANRSLLEIELFTGRKHQIRVHFSEAGHPVVGDRMYGTAAKGSQRLALHATSLSLRHPATKEEMVFRKEAPRQFAGLLRG